MPGVLECEHTWDERARIQQENVRAHKEDIEYLTDSFGTRDKRSSDAQKKPSLPILGRSGGGVAGGEDHNREGYMDRGARHETSMTQNGCLHDATKDFKKSITNSYTEIPVLLLSIKTENQKKKIS